MCFDLGIEAQFDVYSLQRIQPFLKAISPHSHTIPYQWFPPRKIYQLTYRPDFGLGVFPNLWFSAKDVLVFYVPVQRLI